MKKFICTTLFTATASFGGYNYDHQEIKEETKKSILLNKDKIENYEMFLDQLDKDQFTVEYGAPSNIDADNCRTYPKCSKIEGPEICETYRVETPCTTTRPGCFTVRKRCHRPTIEICRDYTICD